MKNNLPQMKNLLRDYLSGTSNLNSADLIDTFSKLMPDIPPPPPQAMDTKEERDDWNNYQRMLSIFPLVRMHDAFDKLKIPLWGRVKEVADKTGYSTGRVSDLLNGNAPINARFRAAVCQAFSINNSWLGGDTTAPTFAHKGSDSEPSLLTGDQSEKSPSISIVVSDENIPIIEAVKELNKMPEPRRWEAVGMLKRMNNDDGK